MNPVQSTAASGDAPASRPNPLVSLWQGVIRLERGKVNPYVMALRNALAVAIPLAACSLSGYAGAGAAVATGALNVAYSDGSDPFRLRARRMLLWSTVGAISVYAGVSSNSHHVWAVVLTATWAFLAGMLTSLGTRAGDLGLNTLVSLIVFAARSQAGVSNPLAIASLVFAGGLIQTASALLLWPVQRYRPERMAISASFSTLAGKLQDNDPDALTDPLAESEDTATQDVLSALGSDYSLEGQWLRVLFDQADRVRLSAFRLRRLQNHLAFQSMSDVSAKGDQMVQHLDSILNDSSRLLTLVAESLLDRRSINTAALDVTSLTSMADAVRHASDQVSSVGSDVSAAVEVLTGQMRAIVRMIRRSDTEDLAPAGPAETARPWAMQIQSWRDTLLANLSFASTSFRHAIRLMVFVTVGDALSRSLSWQRTYWIPMTIAVILKPDFASTFTRGLLRLAGTFGGLLLATALYHFIRIAALSEAVLVFVFTFLLRRFGPANYGIFSTSLTGLVVFLIAATGIAPGEVVVLRGLNTLAGGCLALLAYAVWPTWERRRVGEVMAEMLDCTRDYFQQVITIGTHSGSSLAIEADDRERLSRQRWRRSRLDAESSVERVSTEPRISRDKLSALESMLASTTVIAHTVMGLEAGFEGEQPEGHPIEGNRKDQHLHALDSFAHNVEFTLYYLAAALRGSANEASHLPSLRQSHGQLVDALGRQRLSTDFVLIETDRLVVALNTLSEQVVRFVH